jgi:hypothetical protein
VLDRAREAAVDGGAAGALDSHGGDDADVVARCGEGLEGERLGGRQQLQRVGAVLRDGPADGGVGDVSGKEGKAKNDDVALRDRLEKSDSGCCCGGGGRR